MQCFLAFWVTTVQLAVNAYIVPDGAIAHEILLGTDSWARFPVLEYKYIGDDETILTLRTTQHEDRFRESFSESIRMTACTECAFQNGVEHKLDFDSDTTEMMWLMHEDVSHVSPRCSILLRRVRQKCWLMHEDVSHVSPRCSIILRRVRQKCWLMHEDVSHVSPGSSILVSRVRPKWWMMQVDVNYP